MSIASRKTRFAMAVLALAGALTLISSLWANTSRSEAAGLSCGTFTVEHNDRIGNLSLPKGKYTVRVINSGLLSCSSAISNFRNFLWDYDGKLPKPWRYTVLATGQGRFYQRTNTQVAFSVKKQTAPTPGPTPGPGKFQRCPGTFKVLNNDMIGALSLPKGLYYIYAAVEAGPSCTSSEDRFRNFLSLGQPRAPWIVKPASAVFTNPKTGAAFRVKQAS